MDAYHWGWVRERLGCAECRGWYVEWQFGSARYDGHCLRCFREKFPEEERVKQRARTERYVKAFVEVFFPEFVQAQAVETAHRESAHRRTITHYAVVRGTMICVDTDEQAYRRHDPADEVARYNEIVRFWRGRTVFVRLDLDAEGCALTQQLERLRGALGRLRALEAGALVAGALEAAGPGAPEGPAGAESLLEVVYLFRARGRQARYDEGSVPGWLEAWGACQEAWGGRAERAGSPEGPGAQEGSLPEGPVAGAGAERASEAFPGSA